MPHLHFRLVRAINLDDHTGGKDRRVLRLNTVPKIWIFAPPPLPGPIRRPIARGADAPVRLKVDPRMREDKKRASECVADALAGEAIPWRSEGTRIQRAA